MFMKKFLSGLTYILNIIIVVLTIVVFICNYITFINKTIIAIMSVLIIGLQIISIIVSFFYDHFSEKLILKKIVNNSPDFNNKEISKREILKHINPTPKVNGMQNSRDVLRNGLKILLSCSIFICIFLCLALGYEGFFFFVSSICLLSLFFMYADYLPSLFLFGRKYDSLFIPSDETPNFKRGLARIYLAEYKQSKFKRKNCYYNNANIRTTNSSEATEDDCLKCILYILADTAYWPVSVCNVIFLAINILTLPNNFINNLYTYFFDVSTPNGMLFYIVFIVFINILFFLSSITSTKNCDLDNEKFEKITDLFLNENYESRKEKVADEKYCSNSIVARGIYVYYTSLIDKGYSGEQLETIEKQCSLQIRHRYYANRDKFLITIALLFVSVLFTLLGLKTPIYLALTILITFLGVVSLLYILVLPNISKWIIGAWCKKYFNKEIRLCQQKRN